MPPSLRSAATNGVAASVGMTTWGLKWRAVQEGWHKRPALHFGGTGCDEALGRGVFGGVAEVGYYQADGFVGDFFGEGIFDGFEEVEAEGGGGLADLFEVDGVDPVGAEGEFALFDEVGNEDDDGIDFAAAELGDFFEGVAFFEEFAGFLRGAGGAAVPFLAGAFAVFEAAERIEDGFAVIAAFGFADAGDAAEFFESFGFAVAEILERGIVENDERGDTSLRGGGLAPLAQKFAQLFIHGRKRRGPGRLAFKRCLFDGAGRAGT